MTDLHPCPDLDAYLDGGLSDADARTVDTHAASCAACADELAIARRLSAEFASMRDETCPPDLVAEAIAAAQRRAPDRAPARTAASRFARLNRWAIACVVLAAGAIGLSRLIADRQLAPTPSSAPDELAEVRPAPAPEPTTSASEAMPQPAAERDARTSAPASSLGPIARRETRPRAVALPPAVDPPPAVAPPPSADAPDPAPDDAEIEQAQADLLLALALVADAQSHARSNVTHQLERAADALHDTPIH